MNALNTATQLGGRYQIKAFVPGNPPRILADWFPNLITNYGMDLMSGANSNYSYMWEYCSVGTGNTPPAFANSQLINRKATTSDKTAIAVGKESAYIWKRMTYQFKQGAASGNLAEVGIGANSNGSLLFSRALIKDTQGNPTTITVLPDEVLQVVWEIRHYFPAPSQTTVTIAGSGDHQCHIALLDKNSTVFHESNSYNYIHHNLRSYCNVYSGVSGLVPETQNNISHTDYNGIYMSDFPLNYTSGSFKTTRTLILPVDQFNWPAGISGLSFNESNGTSAGGFQHQVYIDPPIMKTPEQQLSLTLALNWARA
ncbi:hypothetical protein AXE65_08850 [Ventosimonas gracilis]|uniref:Uncharacterized protein n=1 Tax=Ventosimonas gracilis TaxID=1680762 RepID=A0A139SY80_9GAMM|nr:hypothetical protein [Ventosimonas gracilis]KXU39381.1 hypothetical protein AXE65_08850 [Ventosimonas gracilis]